MIRLFNVYYPTRLLVLVAGEILVVCASFFLGAFLQLGRDSLLVFEYENGFYKILGITAMAVIFLYYFDLYDPHRVPSQGETYYRILVVLGLLSFSLAGVTVLYPGFLLGQHAILSGLFVLVLALFGWRSGYAWLIRRPLLRERLFVLGNGDRARNFVATLRSRPELGIDVVGWSDAEGAGPLDRDRLGTSLLELAHKRQANRVVVALGDRRGTMPVRELLDVRLSGVRVEDVTGIFEKISGKVEIEGLYPSWLIFSEGFKMGPVFLMIRRLVSIAVSFLALLIISPFLPLVALAIKLDSPGPVFYRQKRVGRKGEIFYCYKFRTMRSDAETTTGPTWAGAEDPRVTRVGRWLRRTRVDEIPQLWNVLRGDMGFVGPRPERPEFVEWLIREIPYYNIRHIIRPGLTGWAQVCYHYGASLEEAKQKLEYDLYYIKNISLGLDIVIILRSIKIIVLGRGAR